MIPRRRFLTVLAGAAALPALPAAAASGPYQWRGIALGAEARIILDHTDAAALVTGAVAEIRRLERIFSLYRPESALSRLNERGVLREPPPEMVELLSLCDAIHARTCGAFDPTVQPLWALYAQRLSAGGRPTGAEISAARRLVGWHRVEVTTGRIAFAAPDMQLTLNGIAQGYIADRLRGYFHASGVRDVLINTGEIAALGNAPDGPWRARPGRSAAATVPLSNLSIATSAPAGTTFGAGEALGHIIDPRTGVPGGRWAEVTVIAPSAATADGLSTGFTLMTRDRIGQVLGNERVFLS